MIKKTLTLLTIMFISLLSMGWSMEQKPEDNFVIHGIEFTITPSIQSTFLPNLKSHIALCQQKISEEVVVSILNWANEDGLDLKTYRNQILVCKDWGHLAVKSITTLDITKLLETTPHRKCTLMAHIIADSPLHRFPNLRSLNISFQGFGIFEFYKKIMRPEKRNFNKQKNYFSDDQRLESYERDLVKIEKEISEYKPNPDSRFPKLSAALTILSYLPPVAWGVLGHDRLTGRSSTSDEKNRVKMDSMYTYLEKKIVTSITDFQTLTTLKIHPLIDSNLFFIGRMPNLKYFELISGELPRTVLSGREPTIFLDSLGGFYKSHDLEVLHINAPTIQLANFEGWSKFHKLRELSLPFEFCETIGNEVKPIRIDYSQPRNLDEEEREIGKIHGILDSLVKNIPGLESLQIKQITSLFDPRIKLSKYISQLPKLEKLDASYVLVNDDDLVQFKNIKTLKKIILMGLSEADRKKFYECSVIVFTQLNLELKLYTPQGLDLFKLARPDVQIEFRLGTCRTECEQRRY